MTSLITELSSLLWNELPFLVPYLAVFIAVHTIVQYILPLFYPSLYDFLDNKTFTTVSATFGKRASLAADMRTKVIAGVFALHVASLSLWYLMFGAEVETLQRDVDSSTWLTTHLMRCAVAYFLWDLFVCYVDKYSIEWWLHAICCLAVFTAALRPFLHYMGLVTLLYEASTPFLHTRKLLIQANYTKGIFFTITTNGFALSFFASRIVYGLYKCWYPGQWNSQMMELLQDKNDSHNPHIIYMYQVCCVALSLLNIYWMYAILAAGFRSEKKSKGN